MNIVKSNRIAQLRFILPMCISIATLNVPASTFARDVKIGGGVSTGYEFDDRKYDDDSSADQEQQTENQNVVNSNDERYSRFRLAPLLTLSSSSARDEINLRYSPSFRYDFENSDNEVDHDLSARFNRFITRDWQLKFSENYLLTDSVESQALNGASGTATPSDNAGGEDMVGADSTVKLSDNQNRRRYWTNNLSLHSEYSYWEDSLFSLGYAFNVLRNIDNPQNSSYEDYDRHEVSTSVAHRFTSAWKLSVNGSYVRGLYDEANPEQISTTTTAEVSTAGENTALNKDLNEYRAATALEANLLDHQSQKLSYSFYGVDYDAAESNNSTIHDMTLGWQWDISKELMFSLGAGPTYYKVEGSDGQWGYNGNLALKYAFERGSIGLTANRGYERQNFNGTNENGLREFWQSRFSLNYQVLQDLSATLFSSYRYEDEEVITAITPVEIDEPTTVDNTDFTTTIETFNRKRFSSGASLGYSFWQWYKLALSYNFTRQDSEQVDDSFDEHRVVLTLSYEKELFNW